VERAVEIFALVHLVILGVSHAVKHAAWAELFVLLAKHGRSGVFFHGFLSLWFGSIVVGLYRVYSGPGLALTLFGWLVTLKAAHCLCFPDAALRTLQRVSVQTSWKFIPVGVIYLILACVVAYQVLTLPDSQNA
jgi:hypothetical protein